MGPAPDAGSNEGFSGGPSGAAASGAALRASAASEVETLKASEDIKRQRNQSLMANQAQSAMIDLEGVVGYDPSMRTGSVLSAEDADIPQGVHETSYDIQNGLVITRTVRVDDVVTRYRKVVMKTGTYYFCGARASRGRSGIWKPTLRLMGLARQAILLTLVVHAVVLGFLVVWPASEARHRARPLRSGFRGGRCLPNA